MAPSKQKYISYCSSPISKPRTNFFTFTFDDVRADVDYVLAKFFKKTDVVFQGNITRQRINQQKQIILNLFDYQAWSVEQAIQVEAHIGELLRYSTGPLFAAHCPVLYG